MSSTKANNKGSLNNTNSNRKMATLVKCFKCKAQVDTRETVECSYCKNRYEFNCVGLSEKLYRLMDAKNKKNWECPKCGKKPKNVKKQDTKPQTSPCTSSSPSANTNVTVRKKTRDVLSDSDDAITDSTISTADTLLNRSCPENTVLLWEELEDLKSKIVLLETKLESADNEIERLLAENYSLRNEISNKDSKINNLTRIYQSTPTSCNRMVSTPNSCNRKVPTPCRNDSKPARTLNQDLEKSPSESSTSINSSANEAKVAQVHIKKKTAAIGPHQKICLISANKHNKTRKIALSNLRGNVCHYLMPDSGVKRLLEGIDAKLSTFTMEDYCVLLIGEEDFNTTTDYFELITILRDSLKKIDNTNVIICLPTYKCCKYFDLFNWRVEIFNNLLHLDVMTHEYAFLVDSNRNLRYDKTMFTPHFGTLNNYGLNVIFQNVNIKINEIKTYNLYKECNIVLSPEKQDCNNILKNHVQDESQIISPYVERIDSINNLFRV